MSNNDMRTRFYLKMTNGEIEEYLERNDLVFIPVGNVENHGDFPVDVEQTVPEAFALKLAEATDGLVLSNLSFFYTGNATLTSRASINLSVMDGAAYLEKIALSLINQGFRRQIYLSLHAPAVLTIGPVITQIFEDTKIPIMYIDLIDVAKLAKIDFFQEPKAQNIFYGAYKILNKLDELPIRPGVPSRPLPMDTDFVNRLRTLSHMGASVGFYFTDPDEHAGFIPLQSEEERDRVATEGVGFIDKMIETIDIEDVLARIKKIDDMTQNIVLPKYGKWLPKKKYSDPNY
ncbi:MAG: creatininase family protein [Anaerolineaceae bacterium]